MFTMLVYSRDIDKLETFKIDFLESTRFKKSNKFYAKCDSIREYNGRYMFKGYINPRSDDNMILELDLDKYNDRILCGGLDIRMTLKEDE